MDEYFGHREYCVKKEKTSRLGRVYEFHLPNGIHVSVSRNMKILNEWFGKWEVRIIASEKIRIYSVMGHKYPKEVECALEMLSAQTFV